MPTCVPRTTPAFRTNGEPSTGEGVSCGRLNAPPWCRSRQAITSSGNSVGYLWSLWSPFPDSRSLVTRKPIESLSDLEIIVGLHPPVDLGPRTALKILSSRQSGRLRRTPCALVGKKNNPGCASPPEMPHPPQFVSRVSRLLRFHQARVMDSKLMSPETTDSSPQFPYEIADVRRITNRRGEHLGD